MKVSRISFIGSHGIPANHGGFETFVEKASIGLQENENFEVTVICEQAHKKLFNNKKEYNGVRLAYSWFNKTRTPNLYYLSSILLSIRYADVIYACGEAGAFSIWISKMFGVKYVSNPDGLGWERDKYNWLFKKLLYVLAKVNYSASSYVVCDSEMIKTHLQRIFKKRDRLHVIEYGADQNEFINGDSEIANKTLEKYGLKSNQYHLVVSRLEPENNVHIIIDGYTMSPRQMPLAIIGRVQDTDYCKSLADRANTNLIFLGGVYDPEELKMLRAKATSYFHGHKVGGTNPSLLEAMAAANLCVCHDNEFNREVTSENALFFSDEKDVERHLNYLECEDSREQVKQMKETVLEKATNYYSWEKICNRYAEFFQEIPT